MVITYHGIECCKVSLGETVLAFNPISKEGTHKPVRFGADIALSTLNHADMNGFESVTQSNRELFSIYGPGEYEVNKITIRGVASTSGYGGSEKVNTIYVVTLEGITLCFLGALNSGELSSETRQIIDSVDILFVPIGGNGVLSPSDAHKLAVSLEPKVTIPIHYGNVGEKDALTRYLKEEGVEDRAPVEKLTVKRKDIEDKEGEVVVLSA